jgi:uncharacterized RDD family membrane protein YckC
MTEGGGGYGDQYQDQYRGQLPSDGPAPWEAQHQSDRGQPTQQAEPGAQPAQPAAPPAQPAQSQFPHPPGRQQYAEPYQGAPNRYGQNPYPHNPYAQAPWAGPPGFTRPNVALASWGSRAAALILDWLFSILGYVPAIICWSLVAATAETSTDAQGVTTVDHVNGGLIVLGILLSIGGIIFALWNAGYRQGAQGWSFGKQIIGIKLVREDSVQPPGGGLGIGRLLLRGFLGGITGGIYTVLTYLWPLWDEKNQSLDDKIFSTLVVRAK